MPRLTDIETIRRLLNQDRDWAAYAIGDLAPGYFERCEWRVPADAATAVLMIYRGFTPPIVFAMGETRAMGSMFGEIQEPTIALHIRPDVVDVMSSFYVPTQTSLMLRMTVRRESFRPSPACDDMVVTPIDEGDVTAIEALYEDGHRRGEGPTHFSPAMLGQGTFRGIWEGDALVSVAGTHLYSPEMGVCAIGNVYTRSDRRGRGLGAWVTSAVVTHAIADAIETIVLNVGENNSGARRVYERLGFVVYGPFLEGEATRRSSAT